MVFDIEAQKFAINFIIVSITASIAKTITAPIERIKLILQNQDSSLQVIKGQRQRYKGIIDCLRRLPKEQGYKSFWRGNGTNILRYFPTQALNFAFNDVFIDHFSAMFGDGSHKRSVLTKFLSGGLAGVCTTTIVYPLEFCLTRIACDMGSDTRKKNKAMVRREFRGLLDCVRKVHKTEGIRGLYGGYQIAVFGISSYRALYFGLFDSFKHIWAHHKNVCLEDAPKPPLLLGLLFAQSVTCIAGTCTYPLDTVARRLMLESGRPKHLRLFENVGDAFKIMYKSGGIFAFYRGAFTNCIRGLSGGLVLVFYDEVLHYTKWKDWLSPCENC